MRKLQVVFSLVILGVLIGGPLAYLQYHRRNLRNFHVVREGVLYRSGQLSVDGLRRLVHEYGIKTVLTLRFPKEPGMPPPDLKEELFCKQAGLRHFRISSLPWYASVGPIPAQKNVDKFLRIVNDPANHPVLVHCFAGMHRAGTYCAVYRMEFDRWSPADAIREMKHFGYEEDHFDVLSYLEHYQRRGLGEAPSSETAEEGATLVSPPPLSIGDKGRRPTVHPLLVKHAGQDTAPPQWSVWGTLRKSPFRKDGQPIFVLEDTQGTALLYATAEPGTELNRYVGRTVSLYGSIRYWSDDSMRTNLMTASHVAVP